MLACCAHAKAAERLFSHFAKIYRLRYQLFGLERSQRQLAAGLANAGLHGARLLEIGCGVGFLHQWLLEQGAYQAIGVDLSARLLAEAKALARQRGLDKRVRYVHGDFLALAETLEPVDFVILDKVICCYPDARALLRQAAAKARRAVALTYPRIHRISRTFAFCLNRLLAIGGSDFRVYLHDPDDVEAWLAEAGFRKATADCTWLWLTQVFTQEQATS